jgi:hypothetical protein
MVQRTAGESNRGRLQISQAPLPRVSVPFSVHVASSFGLVTPGLFAAYRALDRADHFLLSNAPLVLGLSSRLCSQYTRVRSLAGPWRSYHVVCIQATPVLVPNMGMRSSE